MRHPASPGYLLLKLQNKFLHLVEITRQNSMQFWPPFLTLPVLAFLGFHFLSFWGGLGDSAKTQYNEILANVDYLHGIAESFLTITNLLIVAAFRKAVVSRERKPAEGEDQQGPFKVFLRVPSTGYAGNPLGRLLVARCC